MKLKPFLARLRQVRWSRGLAQALWAVIPPVTAFYLMQFVFGADLLSLKPGVVAANAICIGVLYFLLWALSGRAAVSCLVLHVAALGWGMVNYFVLQFRGTPVLPWDLTALSTAMAVSGSYTYALTARMLLGIALVAALLALFLWLRGKEQGKALFRRSRWGVRVLAGMLAVACTIPVTDTKLLAKFGVKTNTWNHEQAYQNSGIIGSFLRNLEFLTVEEPDDTSPERLSQILSQVMPSAPADTGVVKPNIVAIMNESWADFEEFGQLELSESVTSTFRSLDNAVWGHSYTSIFGAGTSASEFEFLTGNSMAFLPSGSIPYQQYIMSDLPSMASLLREEGYETLAFHPGEYFSWQRDRAYPRLGFDDFKCKDDMDVEKAEEHGYISDASDFDQVIWEFEHKQAGQPLFLFNVTIQSHSSYSVKDYPSTVQILGHEGEFPKAEQYLTLASKTNQSFQKLIDYFSQVEEPTILVMFGDHQPSVEQEFLDLAYGVEQKDMTMKQYMGKFRTPYVMWANYPVDWSEAPEETSLNFLGLHLLHYAGIESDSYGQFLWEFQKQVPALTFVGYTDETGHAYSHWENTVYDEAIDNYQRLQYARMFGTSETALR